MIFNGDATNKNMMSVYLNMAALFVTDGENDDEWHLMVIFMALIGDFNMM